MNRKTCFTLVASMMLAGSAGALSIPALAAPGGVEDTAAGAVERHNGAGEVTNIDRDAGRIELKHGPIQSLGWPAMRMAFRVTDPKLLDGIETGQRVRFTLSRSPDGSLKISELAPGN